MVLIVSTLRWMSLQPVIGAAAATVFIGFASLPLFGDIRVRVCGLPSVSWSEHLPTLSQFAMEFRFTFCSHSAHLCMACWRCVAHCELLDDVQ